MISARFLAYQILLHMDQKASHPDRLIRAMLERHSQMEERDRALTTELVYGVLRRQGRLFLGSFLGEKEAAALPGGPWDSPTGNRNTRHLAQSVACLVYSE